MALWEDFAEDKNLEFMLKSEKSFLLLLETSVEELFVASSALVFVLDLSTLDQSVESHSSPFLGETSARGWFGSATSTECIWESQAHTRAACNQL